MNIVPLRKSPNISLALLALSVVFTISILSSFLLEPYLGESEATLASLFLNFVLTAGLMVIYLGMARDQEDQTQLIEQQVEIANLQREVMEVNHLPLLDIETGYDLHNKNRLGSYEIEIQNRGNGVALNPNVGINVHLITRGEKGSKEKLGQNWEPIFRPLMGTDSEGRERIERIEPGELCTAIASVSVRDDWLIRDKHEIVEILPTESTEQSNAIASEEVDAVVWQPIIAFDTLLPTRDTIYRFHQPLQIECENGHALLEDSQFIPNEDEIISKTSIQSPGTYNVEDCDVIT